MPKAHVTDRQDHVLAFAERIHEAIHSSKKLEPWIISDTNEHVKFANGSILYMITGYGKFEKARSYPVDFCVIDEVQSLDLDGLPVVKETLSASPYKRLILIGTGSDEGDLWYKEWMSGVPHEWNSEKKEWNIMQFGMNLKHSDHANFRPSLPGIG